MKSKLASIVLILFFASLKAQSSRNIFYNTLNNKNNEYFKEMPYTMVSLATYTSLQTVDTISKEIIKFRTDFYNQKIKTEDFDLKRADLKEQYINWVKLSKRILQASIEKNDPLEKNREDLIVALKSFNNNLLPNGELPLDIKFDLGYTNLISITEIYKNSNSIKKTIEAIKSEYKKGYKSNYYIDSQELLLLGKGLYKLNKNQDAFYFYVLKTELFPSNPSVKNYYDKKLFSLYEKENSKDIQIDINNTEKFEILNNLNVEELAKLDSDVLGAYSLINFGYLDKISQSISSFESDFVDKKSSIYESKREELKTKYIKFAKLIQKENKALIAKESNKEKVQPLVNLAVGLESWLPNGNLPKDVQKKLGYYNLLSISDFYKNSNSIDKTIELIESENRKGSNSKYDTAEDEINTFGYELINSNKKEEALSVFIINTKLYPKGFNTFDSLGECLLLLNKKNEGVDAYKKSLALNPNNENAKKVISEMK